MRILSVVRKGYYGSTRAIEPMFLFSERNHISLELATKAETIV